MGRGPLADGVFFHDPFSKSLKLGPERPVSFCFADRDLVRLAMNKGKHRHPR
jgi:hypothetical protein